LDLHFSSLTYERFDSLSRFQLRRDNVNVRHLAELAGLLSVHALQIVESPDRVSQESFRQLAEISQKRADAWHLRMQSLLGGSHHWSHLYADGLDPRSPLIEEILVSEILSRVVAGLLTAQGQQRGDQVACRMGADVFNAHQPSRRLVLTQMIEMLDAQNPAVRKLDRLRRLAERWTDILLGPLACRFSIKQLVFDPARANDYGQSILPYLTTPAGSGLFAAGLRVAFPETIIGVPAHAGFHRDMAAAVMGLLPKELFECDGGMLPLRTVRSLRRIAADAKPAKCDHPRKPGSSDTAESQPLPPSKLSFSQLRRGQQKS
jgi:hypothetical protein